MRTCHFVFTSPAVANVGVNATWQDNDCDGVAGGSIQFGTASSVVKSTFTNTKVTAGDNSNIADCTVTGASGYGIDVGQNCLVRDCVVSGVTKNVGTGEPGDGIRLGAKSLVRNCVVCLCDRHGINLDGGNCSAVGNNSCNNSQAQTVSDGAGIYALDSGSFIDSNVCNGNDYGIRITGTAVSTTVIRNKVNGNSVDNIDPNGPAVGPVGDAATSTSPFANFF